MSIKSQILYRIARRRVLGRSAGSIGANAATFDAASYRAWREDALRKQFEEFFSADDVRGRDVLDFGCGEGGLSFLAARYGANSVIGMDLAAGLIESARAQAREDTLEVVPTFVVPRSADRIELDDASVDCVLCFDVLEHVMQPKAVIAEWRRVLRPGGDVLIWWVPWWNPWGAHIESLVPIPWAHVVCNDAELCEVCARIYDMPEFKPRLWDLDERGNKKPNKWRAMRELPGVNRLTVDEFENLCGESGLAVDSRVIRGFGSSGPAKLTHALLKLPHLRDYFTSCVAYRLRKPATN